MIAGILNKLQKEFFLNGKDGFARKNACMHREGVVWAGSPKGRIVKGTAAAYAPFLDRD